MANQVVQNSGLPQRGRGRLQVNQYLQVEGYPEVFAAGDNCGLTWEEEGRQVLMPALVESALATGKTAATNIIASLAGKPLRPSRPKYHGLMVSVGRWWGVADIMGLRLVGFLAIAIKHLVNLHYLFGIGGFELIFGYLHHEFFGMREDYRSTPERQFTRQRPLFFLVPLRLYLGYMWLQEGITKLADGWWHTVMLGKSVMTELGGPAFTVDTTSGATLLELVGPNTPSWYQWFVEGIIYPNSLLFQRLVVITEIGLGLAFLLGFMTIVAAIVSIAMNINFLPVHRTSRLLVDLCIDSYARGCRRCLWPRLLFHPLLNAPMALLGAQQTHQPLPALRQGFQRISKKPSRNLPLAWLDSLHFNLHHNQRWSPVHHSDPGIGGFKMSGVITHQFPPLWKTSLLIGVPEGGINAIQSCRWSQRIVIAGDG